MLDTLDRDTASMHGYEQFCEPYDLRRHVPVHCRHMLADVRTCSADS
jgi:hypothetical protein